MKLLNKSTFLHLRNSGVPIGEIALRFQLTIDELTSIVKKNRWGLSPLPKINNILFFREYNEYSCYWGGFLAADGNVDSKNRIRLMLKYEDIGHLNKLKECLQSTHKVSENTTKYNRCSFEFTHKDMCEDLKYNFNIVPNKTPKYVLPKAIPLRFMKDYIRGYFDGDGCICESFSNKNSKTATLYATIASGSKIFINDLFSYLQSNLDLGGSLQTFKDSVKYQIKFNTNDAKKLLHYMYENSNIYLDRKNELYSRIVKNNFRLQR